ncbi:phage integrase central domain-containing protein [Pseudofrankia sp. BMG5.37]|uniref:phage integrase central domain-containing protein n=1 Tax=Pseudofrankia sp. BMG5.37 TaxID=3050035 RepID=UPI00289622D9|nr:hypothetical protein [Pseudofrankia sp. BMG5.37]MDT3445601.1 hypothetical protein [Pseudofrankia sp. BMG5.37]
MARIKDRWYNAKKSLDGERVKSARYGKGDRWQIEYTDDQGNTKYPTFRTRAAADQFASAVETDLLRGTYVDPDKGKQLFRDYVKTDWLPAQVQHAPSTAETLESDLKNHILPAFGPRQIGQIQRRAVVMWVAERSTLLAPRTLHRVYGFLATILKAAAADGVIRHPLVGRDVVWSGWSATCWPLATRSAVYLPKARPGRSGRMFVLMQDAAEPVASADVWYSSPTSVTVWIWWAGVGWPGWHGAARRART